jgi:hypothetical protein
MTEIYNIDKNDCLKIIKRDETASLHPLLNVLNTYNTPYYDNKPEFCHVLPQLINDHKSRENNTLFASINTKQLRENTINAKNVLNPNNNSLFDDINILDDTNISKTSKSNIVEKKINNNDCHDGLLCIDPIFNFTLPINKNNFLDVVFKISSLEDLKKWLFENDLKKLPIRMVNIVFDLFWENYYNKIDEDFNLFIEINKKLINVIFEKDLAIGILKKIVNTMIKNNYGKKIKYLDKIKKYLMKYNI